MEKRECYIYKWDETGAWPKYTHTSVYAAKQEISSDSHLYGLATKEEVKEWEINNFY